MPTARFGAAAAVSGERFYVFGGYASAAVQGTVQQYDPVSDTWPNCGGTCVSLPTPRFAGGAATVGDKVYVVGGLDAAGAATARVEEYDPARNSWSNCGGTCAPKTTSRYGFAMAVVNGIVYAIGGHDGAGRLATVEAYDPVANGWSARAPMPTSREQLAASAAAGRIYAIGGWSTANLDVVEEYDPATNTWSNCGGTCAALPTARRYAASAAVRGKIYVIGGAGPLGTVERFDPVANSWVSRSAMPTRREQMALAIEPTLGTVFTLGGYNGAALATVEIYDPAAEP
jgi:N-acetylneuraminic acid mutarotase